MRGRIGRYVWAPKNVGDLHSARRTATLGGIVGDRASQSRTLNVRKKQRPREGHVNNLIDAFASRNCLKEKPPNMAFGLMNQCSAWPRSRKGASGQCAVWFAPWRGFSERPWFRRSFFFALHGRNHRTKGIHVMSQHWSCSLRLAVASNGTCPQSLKEILLPLNAVAELTLAARARAEDHWRRALTVAALASLGLPREECRDLIARGLIASDGRFNSSARIVLTDAGLDVFQWAIPFGPVRPI